MDKIKHLLTFALGSAVFCTALLLSAAPHKTLFTDEPAEGTVYFVPQFSDFKEISSQDMLFLKKTLRKAEKNKVKAVIFEMDTPGGRVDVALEYVSMLLKSKVPTVAYLNPQGISAGMIIALAADRIAINPNGVIGDAMPIQIRPDGIKPITDKDKRDSEKTAEKDKAEKDGKDKKPDNDIKDKKTNKDKIDDQYTPVVEKVLKEIQKLNRIDKDKDKDTEDSRIADQKTLTVFFKILEVLAQKNDRPEKVVRAMADPYQRLTLKDDGLDHQKNSPLTLSAAEAKKLNVVDFTCSSKEELMKELKLTNCKVETVIKSPTEQIISFLAHPAVSGLLLILGIIGLYVEIQHPHFGVSGVLGLTALTLFFLGHVASGASDWGPMVICFVGLLLLLIEVFLIPGFGIIGILGISCIMISFFAAFGMENIESAVSVISISLLVSSTLIILLTIYILPKSTIFKKIMLTTQNTNKSGFSSHVNNDVELLHKRGVAYSTLRPAGAVMVDGKRYDVVADGDFIQQGEAIEVIQVDGLKITVKKV
jgi:membrane-bound serine protease (ClpP class)